ncbi:hypothetical protein IE53DRAFT_120614 [Violaceomyces palustris]|uniref:Uncharacterized protein n=1 Tax=Violaceomyces palustris TaxID=1673888 RepID=A0ACD0NVW5_9BASI|nr:hypothetical protein IE53DRAFT_120614 [Violaceomyces palustris]
MAQRSPMRMVELMMGVEVLVVVVVMVVVAALGRAIRTYREERRMKSVSREGCGSGCRSSDFGRLRWIVLIIFDSQIRY